MTGDSQPVLHTLNIIFPFLQEQYGVVRIGLFGSSIRDEATPASDLDIIVTFQEKSETFDNYMELKFYLEDLFHKKVDLVIEDSIKNRIKGEILQEAVFI